MSLHVKCQMVRPGEGALAQVALERPVSSMFTEMTGQLVGAGEFPSTTFPATVVRLLTSVSSEMCLQVRTLCVRFPAASEGAGVRCSALPWPRAPPSLGL